MKNIVYYNRDLTIILIILKSNTCYRLSTLKMSDVGISCTKLQYMVTYVYLLKRVPNALYFEWLRNSEKT